MGKLWTVHMWLVVTLADKNGHTRDESDSVQLVLVAENEEGAHAKALEWLEDNSTPELVEFNFACGSRRKATRVRLASTKKPVLCHEETSGVRKR